MVDRTRSHSLNTTYTYYLFSPDEISRLVIAAVFIVLLLMGEAALFAHAVKTMPDFLSQADVQVP
jgi:hypothetical protein